MSGRELALVFDSAGAALVSVLHLPEVQSRTGVLIVVGGPQYRVGSHRQFVLLARHLAGNGIAALRFDYSGMGDSGGGPRTFEDLDAELRTAIDEFLRRAPGVDRVVLFGLCDAASAALIYAHQDERVAGLALLNPWARGEQTLARTFLRHYYLGRLLSRDFWAGLFGGRLAVGRSLAGLMSDARKAVASSVGDAAVAGPQRRPFLERMLTGLQRLRVPVLLIISGRDLTAAEFLDVVKASRDWRRALGRISLTRHDLADADHTCSRRSWRDAVADQTLRWVRSL